MLHIDVQHWITYILASFRPSLISYFPYGVEEKAARNFNKLTILKNEKIEYPDEEPFPENEERIEKKDVITMFLSILIRYVLIR